MRHPNIFRTLEELAASSTRRAAAMLSSVAVNVSTNNLPGAPIGLVRVEIVRISAGSVTTTRLMEGLNYRGYRSEWNPVRSSLTKLSGCSHAAKCPPFGSMLKWINLGYALSAQLRGAG